MKGFNKLTWCAALALLAVASSVVTAAEKVVLLYTTAPGYLGSFVAADEGFFAKHGLDVEMRLTPNGSMIPAALVSNSAQFGGTSLPVIVMSNAAGLDIVITGGTEVYPSNTRFGIAVPEGSDIKSVKDLVGKRVGVPGVGGTIDILAKKWIQQNGVEMRQVNYVELSLPQMGDALKSGQVDAAALVDPFYGRVLRAGNRQIANLASVVPDGSRATAYASSMKWITAHPDAAKGFRAALKDAEAFIADPKNEAAARASLAKYTKLPAKVAATLKLPQHLKADVEPQSLQFWIDVAREQELLRGDLDPASLIAPLD